MDSFFLPGLSVTLSLFGFSLCSGEIGGSLCCLTQCEAYNKTRCVGRKTASCLALAVSVVLQIKSKSSLVPGGDSSCSVCLMWSDAII